MPRLYPRLASIGAALLCLVACLGAHAKDTAMTQPNSLCFGRFIVDLPEGAEIQDMGQQSEYMYGRSNPCHSTAASMVSKEKCVNVKPN